MTLTSANHSLDWDTCIELTPKGHAVEAFLTAAKHLGTLNSTDDAEAFQKAVHEKARTAAALWDHRLTLRDVTPLPTTERTANR